MPSTALPKLHEIVEIFRTTPDRDLRGEILMEFADRFVDVPQRIAMRPFEEAHRVPACQSDAFVWVEVTADGVVFPYFAVENPHGISAKALAVILTDALTRESVQAVQTIEDYIVLEIFGTTISMGKGEGLMGMVRMIKALAKQSSFEIG